MASCASSTAETFFAASADEHSIAVLKLHSDLAKACSRYFFYRNPMMLGSGRSRKMLNRLPILSYGPVMKQEGADGLEPKISCAVHQAPDLARGDADRSLRVPAAALDRRGHALQQLAGCA